MNAYAYQAYKKTQVTTASQGDLIIMLFDGAIKFATQAKAMIDERDLAGANDRLLRAQDIVSELMSALNLDVGELAVNLYQLYEFTNELLIQANLKKDPVHIEQALDLLTQLRDTWREVVALV